MQDFFQQLEEVKNLNLPIGQYVIWGSAPLAIRGLRKARDLDIVVTKTLWEKLIKKYKPEEFKKNVIKIGKIEIWNDLLNLTDRLEEIIANSDLIMGLPFLQLSYTLEWKKYWNKEKDHKDIRLIEKFLQKDNAVIKKKNRQKVQNSSCCTVYEYPFAEENIDIAYVEIQGRYPDQGYSLNEKVKAMVFIVSGKGMIQIDDHMYMIEEGDSILIYPQQKYCFEGRLRLLMSCNPSWSPQQYKITKESLEAL